MFHSLQSSPSKKAQSTKSEKIDANRKKTATEVKNTSAPKEQKQPYFDNTNAVATEIIPTPSRKQSQELKIVKYNKLYQL